MREVACTAGFTACSSGMPLPERHMLMSISVIIITHNEEKNIANCLETLGFADEIIVVDSGSVDRTREICERYRNVKFFEHLWEGFGRQKNAALSKATGDWVFSIDADETATPELAADIRAVMLNPLYDGYLVPRKNFYRGQWVRYSGWWPDPVLRLFRRGKAAFSDRPVHETVVLDAKPGLLNGCLEHHSFGCVADFIRKVDSYSSLGANVLAEQGRRPTALSALVKSMATFVKTLVLKRGFLDGYAGVLISFSNAAGVFYRYMKCAELQHYGRDK